MYSYLESPQEILTLDDVYKLLNAVDLLYWDHYICKSSGTSEQLERNEGVCQGCVIAHVQCFCGWDSV